MFWKKYTAEEIRQTVFAAIKSNSDYRTESIIGLPASNLDEEVFYDDAPFLKNSPFISTLVANPNHIGCHTLTHEYEMNVFKGTQEIEIDLIEICAEEIFGGEHDAQDGYVASGGTEANIQAIWIYRNYFKAEHKARNEESALVYSADAHYSMSKASDLLNIESLVISVDPETRQWEMDDLDAKVNAARERGVRYFILVTTLGTTMFGSVDDPDKVAEYFESRNLPYKLHVDAAFGGFIYPFIHPGHAFSFKNKRISSFTIDGHKMLQAPYGTGIFLARKGLMHYVNTEGARYVPGKDYTLCGSRSGANAIAVWMILRSHGSAGWTAKMERLHTRTTDLCHRLDQLGVPFYRNPFMNIITIKAEHLSKRIVQKYHLVSDTYSSEPSWYKIVMMNHVKQGTLDRFISDIQEEQITTP